MHLLSEEKQSSQDSSNSGQVLYRRHSIVVWTKVVQRHPNEDWQSWRQVSREGSSSNWSRTPEQNPWTLHTGSSGMQKCCPDKHSGQISSSRTWQSLKSKHRLVKVENVNHLHSRFSLHRSKQANSSVVVKTPTVELSRHSPDWKHWADQPIKVQILYIRYKI